MTDGAISLQPVAPATEADLAELFKQIKAAGDDRFFHPHPFDDAAAHDIANYRGRDFYAAGFVGGRLVGYGMLRGWDAGYAVPSLGIVIAPQARGRGFSKPLMLFLHEAARQRGATTVRLKVYPDNLAAIKLYEGLGYAFHGEERGQLVGTVTL